MTPKHASELLSAVESIETNHGLLADSVRTVIAVMLESTGAIPVIHCGECGKLLERAAAKESGAEADTDDCGRPIDHPDRVAARAQRVLPADDAPTAPLDGGLAELVQRVRKHYAQPDIVTLCAAVERLTAAPAPREPPAIVAYIVTLVSGEALPYADRTVAQDILSSNPGASITALVAHPDSLQSGECGKLMPAGGAK